MKYLRLLLAFVTLMTLAFSARADSFTIAAASDLRFALDDIIREYRETHPDQDIDVIYGSSGKMTTQIINGAPYDLFFSADISYPQKLREHGLTATEPAVYAIGRLVLWSNTLDASSLTLDDLTAQSVRRIAIAQPNHAPYGQRAREAMKSAGVWQQLQDKLVFGENIAHAAQMAESGAADVGIIALSLAKFPTLAAHGYTLIDDSLHSPLTQGYVVTRRGEGKEAVAEFTAFMETDRAHEIMKQYGFRLPETR